MFKEILDADTSMRLWPVNVSHYQETFLYTEVHLDRSVYLYIYYVGPCWVAAFGVSNTINFTFSNVCKNVPLNISSYSSPFDFFTKPNFPKSRYSLLQIIADLYF